MIYGSLAMESESASKSVKMPETANYVEDRFKFVRADFLQAIEAADGHWHDRPILPNGLAEGVDIFAPELGVEGAYDA